MNSILFLLENNFFRGFVGIFFLITCCYLLSQDKKNISWRLVLTGIIIQLIIAVGVFKFGFITAFFEYISSLFIQLLEFTKSGAEFLFGSKLVNDNTFGAQFAFQILPTIIFFSALTSVLFYLGILQKVVYFFAKIMKKIMGLSGSESLAATGNIFLGQTESPLLVKPYIHKFTNSELLCLMGGGMATIAGGVFIAFIQMLGQEYATHLLTASIMSAPAAIVACKILVPETGNPSQEMKIPNQSFGTNIFDAITLGTVQGVKLAVNVGAMILVFIAFIALINAILGFLGDQTGLNSMVASNTIYDKLSLEMIFGYIFSPIVYLMGVPFEDMILSGQLLGEKTVANEFIAYDSLSTMIENNSLSEKSRIMATYFLCGFANFLSIGIQVGGISVLAPNKRKNLAKLGIKALIAGTVASLMTAVMAGMLI